MEVCGRKIAGKTEQNQKISKLSKRKNKTYMTVPKIIQYIFHDFGTQDDDESTLFMSFVGRFRHAQSVRALFLQHDVVLESTTEAS